MIRHSQDQKLKSPAGNPSYAKSQETVQVNAVRKQLGIRVSGFDTPSPVEAFDQCGLGPAIMAVIKKAGYDFQLPHSFLGHRTIATCPSHAMYCKVDENA